MSGDAGGVSTAQPAQVAIDPRTEVPSGVRPFVIAAVIYAVFVLGVSLSFSQREIWSDEAVSLALIGGHDLMELDVGEHPAPAVESLYAGIVDSNPLHIWTNAAITDNHTPGYPALFAALLAAGGAATVDADVVRLINVALSASFVFAAVALLGQLGAGAGWVAAAFVTLSPFAIYASREIRAYGLLLPLGLLMAWLCLRFDREPERRWLWLACIVAVAVAGCAMHKLFLGVVLAAGIHVSLGVLRRRSFAADLPRMAAAAAVGAALLLPMPNLLTTRPTIGAFETEWLMGSGGLLDVLNASVTYLAYAASWWVTPPDDIVLVPAYWPIFVFTPLVLWATWLMLRALLRRPPSPIIAFAVVPPAMLLAFQAFAGANFSLAARYSAIWLPAAAIVVFTALREGRERRWFTVYAGAALAMSCGLVLADLSHRSPDKARAFAAAMPAAQDGRYVWMIDGSLHARSLLLALHSEMKRAGRLPEHFLLVDAGPQLAGVAPGSALLGPRRFERLAASLCVEGTALSSGAYFACTARGDGTPGG